MSITTNVNKDQTVVNPLTKEEGGTGGFDILTARASLDIVALELKDAPGGVAITPHNNEFNSITQGGGKDHITVQGPSVVKTNSTTPFIITNFDIATKYLCYCDLGSVNLVGDTLYLNTRGETGTATIVINEQRFTLEVIPTVIDQPAITSPIENSKNTGSRTIVTSTVFYSDEFGTTHKSTTWELSTMQDFSVLATSSTTDETNKTSWAIDKLLPKTNYYIRAKYHDNRGNSSEWSRVIPFTTRDTFEPMRPAIQYPVYASMDINASVLVQASEFETQEMCSVHVSSDWQISTDSEFSSIAWSSMQNTLGLEDVFATGLKVATLYYARVRYTDSFGLTSDWSNTHRFMTKPVFTADTPVVREPHAASTEHYSSVRARSSAFHHVDPGVTHTSTHWQLAHDFVFEQPVLEQIFTHPQELLLWEIKQLKPAKKYYVRVRYEDSRGVYTPWSESTYFETKDSFLPTQPSIVFPTNNTLDASHNTSVNSSVFSTPDLGALHTSSDWELSFDSNFVIKEKQVLGSTEHLLSWPLLELTAGIPYYVRVRYNATKDGIAYQSAWSGVSVFTVSVVHPSKPQVTSPVNAAVEQDFVRMNFTTSDFSITREGEVHASSDWQLSTSDSFGSLVRVDNASTQYKQHWVVDNLSGGQDYYVRVKFRTARGVESEWSSPVKFTTKLSFVPTSCFIISPPDNSRNHSFELTTVSVSQFQAANGQDVHESTHWQVSLTNVFETLFFESVADASARDQISLTDLEPNTTYYVRAKQKGTLSPWTPWSAVVGFATNELLEVVQPEPPEIVYPINEGKYYSPSPTIRSAGFVAGTRGDVHKSTDWEISKDIDFKTKVKSVYESTGYKMSWSIAGLEHKTTYYVRARYLGSIGGLSEWSDPVVFETSVAATGLTGIQIEDGEEDYGGGGSSTTGGDAVKTDPTKPTITFPVPDSAQELPQNITFTSSRFGSLSKDSHKASEWFITDESGSKTIKGSGETSDNKTAWSVNDLEAGETYCVFVKHIGATKGSSEVSDKVVFSIALNTPIERPTIVYPTSLGKVQQLVIESSPYISKDSAVVHDSSDWELFDKDNKLLFSIYDSKEHKTTLPIWQLYTLIAKDNDYLVRVRYKGPGGMAERSAWSKKSAFRTTELDVTLPAVILEPMNNAELVSQPSIELTLGKFLTTSRTAQFLGLEVQLSSSVGFENDRTVSHIRIKDYFLDGLSDKTIYLPNPVIAGRLYIRVKMFSSDGSEPDWSQVVLVNITSGMRPTKEVVRMQAVNFDKSSDYFGFSIALDLDASRIVIGDPGSPDINGQPIYRTRLASGEPYDETGELWTQRGRVYTCRRIGGNWVTRMDGLLPNDVFAQGKSAHSLGNIQIGQFVWWYNLLQGKSVAAGTCGQVSNVVFRYPLNYPFMEIVVDKVWYADYSPHIVSVARTSNDVFHSDQKTYKKWLTAWSSGRLDNVQLNSGTKYSDEMIHGLAANNSGVYESSGPVGGNAIAISRDDMTIAIVEPTLNAVGVTKNRIKTGPIDQKEAFAQQLRETLGEEKTRIGLFETKTKYVYAPPQSDVKNYEIHGDNNSDLNIKDGWIGHSTGLPENGLTSRMFGPRSYFLSIDSSFFGISVALNGDGTVLYIGVLGLGEKKEATDGTGSCGVGHVLKYKFENERWKRVAKVSGKGYGMDVACDETGEIFVTTGFKQVTLQHTTDVQIAANILPQRPDAKVTGSITGTTGTMVYGRMEDEQLKEIAYIGEPDSVANVFTGYGGSSKSRYGQSGKHGSPVDSRELTGSFPYLPGMDPRYLRKLRTGGNRGFDVHFGKKLAMTDAGIPVSVGKNYIQFSDCYIPFTGINPVRDVAVSGDGKYLAVSCGSNREDSQVIIYSL